MSIYWDANNRTFKHLKLCVKFKLECVFVLVWESFVWPPGGVLSFCLGLSSQWVTVEGTLSRIFQILGLQPWMNCVILVTWSRLRWKSCDRMSSVSWTSRLPSIRSLWKTPTAASGRPMKRRHADTSSSDSADRSAGGRQVRSGGRDGPSVTPEGVPPPSAPLEKSVVVLAAGSGDGQGDWRLKGFKAPKGANRLCGGGGLSLGTEEDKESTHGSAQVACAGLGLVELSAGREEAGSGLAGLGAGQSPQEHG